MFCLLLQVHNEIGASPVDIARAYMDSRTSELSFLSKNLISKSEKFSLGNEFSSKVFMPSPLQTTPVRWPGAMTQDVQGYSTPQSQKSRYGLQSFRQTPYSRTMYLKSQAKVCQVFFLKLTTCLSPNAVVKMLMLYSWCCQLTPLPGNNERLASISSTPFQPMRTPLYGKVRSIISL